MSALGPHDWAALRRLARHDNALAPLARLLFEDICDLAAARDGICRKRDESFGVTYGVGAKTIERHRGQLAQAGYLVSVRLPEDGRRRAPKPVWPGARAGSETAANPETRADRGGKPPPFSSPMSEIGEENGGGSTPFAEIGEDLRGQIGEDSVPPPRVVSPPEGGNTARARTREAGGSEGGEPPTLDEVLARAGVSGVSDDDARAFWAHYEGQGWVTSGRHPRPIRNWVAKLMGWKQSQKRFDRDSPGHRGVDGPTAALGELNAPGR